MLLVIKNIKIR